MGIVVVAAERGGEEAVAVGAAFGEGGVLEGLLEGGQEGVAGGVEGVAVLGRWVADGGDEEGPTEHAWVGGTYCWGVGDQMGGLGLGEE